jgi:GxxExxY protein
LGLRDIEEVSGDVLDTALRLHRELGPGLLESVYETVLAGKLAAQGYLVERQKPVDIVFEGMKFDSAFRIDLLIDNRLIVEIKSVEALNAAHHKQLLTYLRLTKQPVGLLINFGGARLMDGFKRVVNVYKPSASPRLRVNQKEG